MKAFRYYSLFLKSLNTCHCLHSEPFHSILLLSKSASVTWFLTLSPIRFIIPECRQYVYSKKWCRLMHITYVNCICSPLLSYKNNRDVWKNGRVWSFDPYVECLTNIRWKQLVITVNETSDATLIQSVLYKVFYSKAYFFFYLVIIRSVHYQKFLYLILKIL